MSYMSFQMKSPPSDVDEIVDDWEQMADSGVSYI